MSIIYTDGSSRGNPGPGGWASVIIEGENVIEIGGAEDQTTNNRMEMKAAIESLKKIKEGDRAEIRTDSTYLLNGITKWVYGWEKNGWITKAKKEVMNKNLWQELIFLQQNKNVSWKKVEGHSGDAYNDRCDIIATSFADKKEADLFAGTKTNYENIVLRNQKVSSVRSYSKTGQAHSYVSMIGGDIQIHKIWAECETRVRGAKGARYRKTFSEENEKEVIGMFRSGQK